MSMDRNREVAVDDLLLWAANPRIDPVDTQSEAFDELYRRTMPNEEASKRIFRTLLDSIASKGFENEAEPVLVQTTESGYEVRDGNRRVSALKCLLHPEAYMGILDPEDYRFAIECRRNHPENVSESIVATVYGNSPEEEQNLDDLLVRKHNGPQDGAGTVQWSYEAKQRFNEAHGAPEDFSSQLESPFDDAFGQTLTSYLGGNGSRSTTKRLISSVAAKEHLGIEDPSHPTLDELKRVKELADELKDMANERHLVLSRLNTSDVKEASERIRDAYDAQPDITDSQTIGDALRGIETKEFRIPENSRLAKQLSFLGGMWNFRGYMLEDPQFDSLNLMLSGLADCGRVTTNRNTCLRRIAVLAPSCRVFFELACSIVEQQPSFEKRVESIRKTSEAAIRKGSGTPSLKERVSTVQHLLRENHFVTFLSQHEVIDGSYKSCKKILDNTDFDKTADMANDMSHKDIANIQIETIKKMFNEAVLFAYICEYLVTYLTTDTQGK